MLRSLALMTVQELRVLEVPAHCRLSSEQMS